MKKVIFGTVLMLVFSNFTCSEEKVSCDGYFPCCMKTEVENYLRDYSPAEQVKAHIRKYVDNNGRYLYVFDPGSNFADWMYTYKDEDCNEICESGGIAGVNTCSDLNLIFVEKVWEDPR